MNVLPTKEKRAHYDLFTPSAEEYIKESNLPWQEYPRPQMRRDNYQLLNGKWLLNGKTTIVPFPPQSSLSGYEGEIGDTLVYEKTFVPDEQLGDKEGRTLLHFGAVDQVAKVWVNDIFVGEHEGGYLHFSFEISISRITGANIYYLLKILIHLKHSGILIRES